MRGTSCVTSEGTMLIGEQKEEEAGEQVPTQGQYAGPPVQG